MKPNIFSNFFSGGTVFAEKPFFQYIIFHFFLFSSVERPSQGCRLLVSRFFFKLKPALGIDLKDWLVETRLKTAQLIYLLLLHLEGEVVGHSEEVLNLLNAGVRDSDSRVVEYVSGVVCPF